MDPFSYDITVLWILFHTILLFYSFIMILLYRLYRICWCCRQDWSHAFYMGKLCEKLGYSYETSLSYYSVAIALNSSAVDPVYRMHASRLKLLCKSGRLNLEVLKVSSLACTFHRNRLRRERFLFLSLTPFLILLDLFSSTCCAFGLNCNLCTCVVCVFGFFVMFTCVSMVIILQF